MKENKIITGLSTDDSVIAALNKQGAELTKKSTPYSLLEAVRISNEEASYKSTNETVVEATNAESPVAYDVTLVAEGYSGTDVKEALKSVTASTYEEIITNFAPEVESKTIKLESKNILATGTVSLSGGVLNIHLGEDGNFTITVADSTVTVEELV